MESHDAEFRESGQGWARKPNRFHATPAEIDQFLRHHFAEDTLLRYQHAIGRQAVAEAVADQRAKGEELPFGQTLAGLLFAAEWVDQHGGPYPSTLVELAPAHADGLDGGVL